MLATRHHALFWVSGRCLRYRPKILVVLVTLLGLFSQLALQSLARLDEMPRSTLERLTGLQIGPGAIARDMHMTMVGMSMAIDRNHTTPHHPHSHHDDGACFLCPLLHLPGIVLATPLIGMLVAVRIICTRYILPPAQAPP